MVAINGNPLLASFCAKTMVYRGLGSGIVRARKDGANIEFRNDEETNLFIATIWRNELAEKSASLDEKSANLSEKGLSLSEKGLSLSEKGLSLSEKGLSLDEKGPSLDEKGPSLNEKGPSLNEKGLSKMEILENKILGFCEVPRSISEISEYLEMSNKSKLRKKYIIPLVGNKLAMTLPNIPSSPKQKYYTIHKD